MANAKVLAQAMRGEDGVLYYPGTPVGKVPKAAKLKLDGAGTTTIETSEDSTGTGVVPLDTDPPEVTGKELPAGFPGRAALVAAGITTTADVAKASDEDLEKIAGITAATVTSIRAATKS